MSKPGTALITGASTGMGRIYADRLARRGYDLVVTARDATRLHDLARQIRAQSNVRVDVIPADLTVRGDVKVLEARIRDDADITLLVNNAGMGTSGPVFEESLDVLESVVIELNVVAPHRLAIAAAQAFIARKRGAIINLGSIASLHPQKTNPTYTATKAFIQNFTESLFHKLEPLGIRVQCVIPGATRTEFFERIGLSLDDRFPADKVMSAENLVDAAMAGFDMGEMVTIPSLPDIADWNAFIAARDALDPNLSRNKPADRYGLARKP